MNIDLSTGSVKKGCMKLLIVWPAEQTLIRLQSTLGLLCWPCYVGPSIESFNGTFDVHFYMEQMGF